MFPILPLYQANSLKNYQRFTFVYAVTENYYYVINNSCELTTTTTTTTTITNTTTYNYKDFYYKCRSICYYCSS